MGDSRGVNRLINLLNALANQFPNALDSVYRSLCIEKRVPTALAARDPASPHPLPEEPNPGAPGTPPLVAALARHEAISLAVGGGSGGVGLLGRGGDPDDGRPARGTGDHGDDSPRR